MSAQSTTAGNYIRRTTGFSAGPVTISCWFRSTNLTPFLAVWAHENGTVFYPGLYTFSGGIYISAGAGDNPAVLGTAAANTWYWAAVIMETGQKMRAYLKTLGGAIAAPVDSANNFGGFSGTTLTVLNNSSNADPFSGQICDFKVWSARLTLPELEFEARVGPPKRTANIYAYLPMVNAVSSQIGVDMSGQGNSFTLTGAPTTSAQMPPIGWKR